jgi:hypothetical protein
MYAKVSQVSSLLSAFICFLIVIPRNFNFATFDSYFYIMILSLFIIVILHASV